MWWDEAARQWRRHPDCTCGRDDGCYCHWLYPLDAQGRPIPDAGIDRMRQAEAEGWVPSATDARFDRT